MPGSSGAAAREIFHDGVLIPPVRYWTKDGVNREVEAILRSNSRVPEVVIGDLRAQVGCTRVGAERLAALCDEYGVDTLQAAMASLLERTAARVRGELARWPDGEHDAEALLDHDGADRSKPVRIKVRRASTATASRSIFPAPTRRPRARSTLPARPHRRSR